MAYEEDAEIQKAVCLGFIIFIENRDDVILPHMNNLIEYMLQKSASPNEEISLQASEFWLACSKLPTCEAILSPYIEKLLPILLKNMRYSDFEINLLAVDSGKSNNNNTDNRFDGKPASDGDGYGALDPIDEPYVGWTLRKCSAASLDALSVKFGDNILPAFIPMLNQSLNHDDCLVKESAILALGAIAEGCMNGLNIYLPELAQYLIKCMDDSKPVIRIITCWTLSRYVRFVVNEARHELYFVPAMMILLKHFLDGNKRIQKAALSAFCVFQEEAGHRLVPYIDVILQAYSECFKNRKFGSYFLLYDAVAVFAQAVGNHLNKQQYIDVLLPPLMHRFGIIEDYCDDQFLAMTECLSNVAAALEMGFLPYADVVYSKCLIVVTETVTACQNYADKPEYFDPPDKEPICGAHDLLLAMAFGLKMYFMKFVTDSCLVEQLYYTMQDDLPMIRQPALALFGEIVKMCFPFIAAKIHDYIPIVIENLDKRFDGTCNNAAWVIGKLCLVMGKGIEPYANQILEHYIVILQSGMGSKAMYQTIAISLCTLGLVCPDEVARQLGIVLKPCCQIMRNIRDCEDKYIGFRGLCELVMRNPNALITDFIHFCDAVASWNSPRPDLTEIIGNILLAFKNQCGDGWTQVYDQFPPLLKSRLAELYNV